MIPIIIFFKPVRYALNVAYCLFGFLVFHFSFFVGFFVAFIPRTYSLMFNEFKAPLQ